MDLEKKAQAIRDGSRLTPDLTVERIADLLGRVRNVEVCELSPETKITPVPTSIQLFRHDSKGQEELTRRYAAGISVQEYFDETNLRMASDLAEAGAKLYSLKFEGASEPFGVELAGSVIAQIRHGEVIDIHGRSIGVYTHINDTMRPDRPDHMLIVTRPRDELDEKLSSRTGEILARLAPLQDCLARNPGAEEQARIYSSMTELLEQLQSHCDELKID